MNNILNAKLKETKLINESYISNFVKKIYVHDKLTRVCRLKELLLLSLIN